MPMTLTRPTDARHTLARPRLRNLALGFALVLLGPLACDRSEPDETIEPDQTVVAAPAPVKRVDAASVRAIMDFLASDELAGRQV